MYARMHDHTNDTDRIHDLKNGRDCFALIHTHWGVFLTWFDMYVYMIRTATKMNLNAKKKTESGI